MLTRLLDALPIGQPPDGSWYAQGPQFEARGAVRAQSSTGEHGLSLKYLGTAGFVLTAQGHRVVLDPYLSRHRLSELFSAPLRSDTELVARHIPEADDVFVGHAHYDHVLDAPELCLRTGARLIGSRAVCNVGRAAGVPEPKLVETRGREDLICGPFTVRGLPSVHGKVLFKRVPFPGDITAPPSWPPRIQELRHGLVLNWLVRMGGFSLLHIDSADFLLDELRGLSADLVCLCAAGWKTRPRYVEEVVAALKPRYVMPCHWDTMVTHAEQPARMIPGIDLPSMMAAIRAAGATPLLLPMLSQYHL
jgi:L-ascorbate metabolism protein UlaG (beta-lactamase superfamily)